MALGGRDVAGDSTALARRSVAGLTSVVSALAGGRIDTVVRILHGWATEDGSDPLPPVAEHAWRLVGRLGVGVPYGTAVTTLLTFLRGGPTTTEDVLDAMRALPVAALPQPRVATTTPSIAVTVDEVWRSLRLRYAEAGRAVLDEDRTAAAAALASAALILADLRDLVDLADEEQTGESVPPPVSPSPVRDAALAGMAPPATASPMPEDAGTAVPDGAPDPVEAIPDGPPVPMEAAVPDDEASNSVGVAVPDDAVGDAQAVDDLHAPDEPPPPASAEDRSDVAAPASPSINGETAPEPAVPHAPATSNAPAPDDEVLIGPAPPLSPRPRGRRASMWRRPAPPRRAGGGSRAPRPSGTGAAPRSARARPEARPVAHRGTGDGPLRHAESDAAPLVGGDAGATGTHPAAGVAPPDSNGAERLPTVRGGTSPPSLTALAPLVFVSVALLVALVWLVLISRG